MEQINETYIDCNGVILLPKDPIKGSHKVDIAVTNKDLDWYDEVLRSEVSRRNYQSLFKKMLKIDDDSLKKLFRDREIDIDSLGQASLWRILTKDNVKGSPDSFFEKLSRFSRRNDGLYFDDYYLSIEQAGMLSALSKKNNELITLISGIPYRSAKRFKWEMSSIWDYLNPDKSAILRPHDKVSGVHSKTAAVAISVSLGSNVVLVEDDRYVAEVVSRYCNIPVFMPISEKESDRQLEGHVRKLGLPTRLLRSSNGEIFFGERGLICVDSSITELFLSRNLEERLF